jgi:hypothetical protein
MPSGEIWGGNGPNLFPPIGLMCLVHARNHMMGMRRAQIIRVCWADVQSPKCCPMRSHLLLTYASFPLAQFSTFSAFHFWRKINVLGPVPEVDVMAKRPQGLLNVGDSFRADGGAAFLRS